MADQKISELTSLTGANVADGDLFIAVDISDTTMAATGTDKKLTAAETAIGLAARPGIANVFQRLQPDASTITYAPTVNLDMQAITGTFRTITTTGNLTLTTSNRAAGRQLTLRVVGHTSSIVLTFPTQWKWLSPKPATLAANKTALLFLTFFGTNETDGIASWAVAE